MRSAKPLQEPTTVPPAENEIQQTLDRRGCQDRQSRRVLDHPHFTARFPPSLAPRMTFPGFKLVLAGQGVTDEDKVHHRANAL